MGGLWRGPNTDDGGHFAEPMCSFANRLATGWKQGTSSLTGALMKWFRDEAVRRRFQEIFFVRGHVASCVRVNSLKGHPFDAFGFVIIVVASWGKATCCASCRVFFVLSGGFWRHARGISASQTVRRARLSDGYRLLCSSRQGRGEGWLAAEVPTRRVGLSRTNCSSLRVIS